MKKILVVLMILAVATGVFAQQGEWALEGSARIGTQLLFDGRFDAGLGTVNLANLTGGAWSHPEGKTFIRGWADDPIQGSFGMKYVRDGLEVGLGFNTQAEITGSTVFQGDRYQFTSEVRLDRIFASYGQNITAVGTTGVVTSTSGRFNQGDVLNRLWGDYNMLNGILTFEIAAKSRDTQWWNSNSVGVFGWKDVRQPNATRYRVVPVSDETVGRVVGLNAAKAIDPFGGPGDTFTKVDGDSMFLANISFIGLEFGVQMRRLFENNVWRQLVENDAKDAFPYDDILRDTLIFGLGFDMEDFLKVAAQFNFAEYGVYLGTDLNVFGIDAGLSFMGLLREDDSDPLDIRTRNMKFGASVGYGNDFFGAGIKGFYAQGFNDTKGKDFDRTIGIEPNFFINAIPDYLRFGLESGFYFPSEFRNNKLDRGDILWGVKPRLDYNFRGTGNATGGDIGTGMNIIYQIVSDSAGQIWGNRNQLDIVFRWNFF